MPRRSSSRENEENDGVHGDFSMDSLKDDNRPAMMLIFEGARLAGKRYRKREERSRLPWITR